MSENQGFSTLPIRIKPRNKTIPASKWEHGKLLFRQKNNFFILDSKGSFTKININDYEIELEKTGPRGGKSWQAAQYILPTQIQNG